MKAAGQNTNKRALSKSIMQMRFMSKSRDTEVDDVIGHKRDTKWVCDAGTDSNNFITIDESYVACEELCVLGRITSKQFNPMVEKLLIEMRAEQIEEVALKEEKMDGVSDEEMANRYKKFIANGKSKKRGPKDDYDDNNNDDDITEERSSRVKFMKPS